MIFNNVQCSQRFYSNRRGYESQVHIKNSKKSKGVILSVLVFLIRI